MTKLIFIMAFIFSPLTIFAEVDQIPVREYFVAINALPSLDSFIDIALNDLSQNEKQELKSYLKSQKIDLSKKTPAIKLVKNGIDIGGKKIDLNDKDLSFKINGYSWKYDESKTAKQHVEQLTKYFKGTAGFSQLIFNKAYADEEATSYFSHSAEFAVAGYFSMLTIYNSTHGNLVNWNTGKKLIAMTGGLGAGYVVGMASALLYSGQSLAVYIANDKASIVCEAGKIFIKIDGKLISPDSLQSNAADSEMMLKYLSKTYTCTKTVTAEIFAKVKQSYKEHSLKKSKEKNTEPVTFKESTTR